MSIHFAASCVSSGLTVYAIIRRLLDGFYWNGSGFEAFNSSHWTTYAQALTEEGVSGVYSADLAIPDGVYTADVRERAGGSPVEADYITWTSETFVIAGGVEVVSTSTLTQAQVTGGSYALSTDSSGRVTPINIDGISHASVMEAMLAVLTGQATVTGNTVVYKKRDGSTGKVTVTFDADGNRTASTIS